MSHPLHAAGMHQPCSLDYADHQGYCEEEQNYT
jgi:hypothetical protein